MIRPLALALLLLPPSALAQSRPSDDELFGAPEPASGEQQPAPPARPSEEELFGGGEQEPAAPGAGDAKEAVSGGSPSPVSEGK
ncbi:MAG: hypothetical protein ACK4N5_25635, partial [Myxococcales bacterium]